VEGDGMKHTFTANTAMGWPEFLEKARDEFKKAQDGADVRLGYRFSGSGESRRMSQLECEYDWNLVMERMRGKAQSARKNPVALVLKNMVSDTLPSPDINIYSP
jgi:hypothetical protein